MKARAIMWLANGNRFDYTFHSFKEREVFCHLPIVCAYEYVPVNPLLYKLYRMF